VLGRRNPPAAMKPPRTPATRCPSSASRLVAGVPGRLLESSARTKKSSSVSHAAGHEVSFQLSENRVPAAEPGVAVIQRQTKDRAQRDAIGHGAPRGPREGAGRADRRGRP
jgi:hypothetical protein